MEGLPEYLSWIVIALPILIIWGVKKARKDSNAMTCNITSDKKVLKSIGQLEDKILSALKNSRFKKIETNQDRTEFYAKSKVSLWSFGEHIQVTIKKTAEFNVVEFFSVCAMSSQIVDWGKNKRNSVKFFKEFDTLVQN